MGNIPLPAGPGPGAKEFRKQLCDFISKCLAHSTKSVNVDAPIFVAGEISIARLDLKLRYTTIKEEVHKPVKIKPVNAEKIAEKIQLNRFSGMDIL